MKPEKNATRKNCVICGCLFKPYRKNNKTCSEECAEKNATIVRNERRHKQRGYQPCFKVCVICKKDFFAKKRNIKTCESQECKDAYSHEKRTNITEERRVELRERDRITYLKKADKRKKQIKEYRIKNPEKTKAHSKVSIAIESKKLVKPECCEYCNSSISINAHHDDYSKPLDVIWLCSKCHTTLHAKRRKGIL